MTTCGGFEVAKNFCVALQGGKRNKEHAGSLKVVALTGKCTLRSGDFFTFYAKFALQKEITSVFSPPGNNQERWLSGLRHPIRNRTLGNTNRGFKSHLLRHSIKGIRDSICKPSHLNRPCISHRFFSRYHIRQSCTTAAPVIIK